jgi:hypothetical protein
MRDCFLYMLEDSGVSAEDEAAFLRGEGPDPFPDVGSDPRTSGAMALLEWHPNDARVLR